MSPNNMTDRRALLILDIDETLLHATTAPLFMPCDHQADGLWIYKRPHVDHFLSFCAQHFRLAAWTSAGARFAAIVFEQVFPALRLEFIYHRDHCINRRDEHGHLRSLKPLPALEALGFTLKRMLVVDDSPEKHTLNPDNLIAVQPYFPGAGQDQELLLLEHYLYQIRESGDLTQVGKHRWRESLAAHA